MLGLLQVVAPCWWRQPPEPAPAQATNGSPVSCVRPAG